MPHKLQEISLRVPEYKFIDARTGNFNPRLPTYTVDCICTHCGRCFSVDQAGTILKELADG